MALNLGGPGGLTFTAGDGPGDLPIKAVVAGQMMALSDGSRYFQDTGLTPESISWSGTFEFNDNFGTPDDKAAYVEAQRDTRARTTLSYNGRSWGGFVQDATLTPIGAGRIKYAVTFEVEIAGTLTLGLGAPPVASHQSRASDSLDAIDGLSGQFPAAAQTANAAVQTARIAAGY